MSLGYSQPMSVDYNTLISENNQLRLAMESLEQENQDLRKRSYQSAHSEIQISTLRSENQILLSEKNDLIKQLRSQSTSNSSYGGEMRGNIEQLLRENDRLNQIIQDFKQKEMRWDQLKSSKVEELYIGEENISSLQAKLAVLSTENDRLNIVINEKEHEVEMLKNKLLPLDSMQVTVLELENKIVVLSTENEKLKAMLSDKSREIETLRMRQNTYSGDRVSPQKETLELKEKLAILSNELDRMNLADMEKDREIDELRDQVRRLNLNSSWEAKNQRLDTEEQSQLQKIKGEKEEYRYRVEELEIRNEAIEAKLQRIVKENEGYKAEIESWRNKYDAIEADLADFPQSEYQHKLTKNHSSEFKTIITEKNAEIDALKEECEILKEKEHLSVKEFERKIGMLVAENERVNNLLKQKKNEIDSIQSKTKKFDDVETKIAMLVMENQKVMTSLNEQKKETENWRNKWRALQSGINAPNTRLEERLASLEEENEKLRIKSKESLVQIETLKDKINQETRGKPSRNAEEARARETELKLSFLTEENESLVKSLMQKEQEVGQLRREIMELKTIETKVAHLQEQITLLVQENDRITIELEDRKRDVEKWRAKAREVEQKNARISELENRLEDVIQEKNRVSEIARNNEEEYHNLEVNYSQLEKELDRLSKKEKKLESVLEGKEDLDEQLSEKIQEVEILKKKLEKANEKVIKAKEMEVAFDVQKNEYETVLKVLDEREEELRAWKSRLEITEKQIGKYEDLKEKEEQLHGDIRVLKENLADKIQELEHQEERKIELHHLKGENEVLLADKAHGDALNENLKQTVEELAMKNNELQGKFTAVKDSYTKGISVFEEKLDRLSKNNEALRDEALRKDEEATNYKEKYETLQKVEIYVKEFEERLRTLAQENERAENELKKREAEIETLKERLNQSNRDKTEVEMRLSMYNGSGDRSTSYGMETQKEIFRKENERLEKVHQESLRENERLRTRCYQLEKLERRNEELEDKIRDLNFAQGRLNTVITEREYEIETWMDKCNAMEKRGAGRLSELERSVEQLEDEISKLKRVIRDYERETDKLKTRILELESIQAEQREREAQLSAKKRAENNEPRYTELRAENDDLIIENAKLKSELSNKTFELGNFNEKYELMQQGLTAKIKSLEEEADQLQQEYNLAQAEVEEWKQRYTAFKETSDRNIAKLRRRADELERDRLSDRSRGMHSNSSRHILLAAEGSNPQSLEVFQLQERLIQSLSENEKLNIENMQLRRESSIRDEIQAGASGDAESRRLYNLVNQKTRENEQLRAQLSALELTSGQRESSRVYETNNAVRMINNDLSTFGGRLSARKTEGSRDNDDQVEGMIMFVMMSAEIERLHLILVEVNETQQDQIEKISVEWERLVEAYKQRLAETEAENETLRAKLVGRSLSGFDNDIYK